MTNLCTTMEEVAARREARRRRILENSEKRLEKITSAIKQEPPNVDCTDDGNNLRKEDFSYVETVTKSRINVVLPSGSIANLTEDSVADPFNEESASAVKNDTTDISNLNIFSVKTSPESFTNQPSTLTSLSKARIHIILLAILVRILYTFQFECLFGGTILIPFGTLELAEMFITSSDADQTRSGIISVAILLCGISPQQVAYMNKLLGILRNCFEDFNLYFFVFVVTHVAFVTYF